MAHNNEFSKRDLELTDRFLKSYRLEIKGDKLLTLCEGISRNWQLFSNTFKEVDVCDLNPSFGKIPKDR